MAEVDHRGPAALPRQLGPYQILRQIGAGGMAEVHLAKRYGASGWEKLVAIKVLRPEHRGRADFEHLLLTEARLGARFAHPGLVSVHDLGLAHAIYYVCMDLVDGGDLAALLARRTDPAASALPAALALFIAEQLASTLAYVHALEDGMGRGLGLVHRDVSPANVLVSRAGAVKLSDFGIAKATAKDDATWGRLRMGKYAYMAPEQITGEPLSAAADVFALGVTLHELLLGRRPFSGGGPLQTMDAIRRAELPASHDFGPLEGELVALLRSALHPRAADRLPGGAAAFVRVLGSARRRHPPMGMAELGSWVCASLAREPPAARSASVPETQTLAVDEG